MSLVRKIIVLFKKKKETARRSVYRGGGSRRPSFSYYAADKTRSAGESVRARQQSSKRNVNLKKLRMVPTFLALAAIVISIVYSTTLSTTPNIVFAGAPSPYHSAAEYQALMSKYLTASLFNHSKLTINTGRVEKDLLTASPELDAAKLVLPVIGRRPTLTLHVRQPALILTTKTNALILDGNGKAVSDTRSLPSSARDALLTLRDESGLELKVGDQAVTNETVAFIDNIHQQLTAKGLTINNLTLPVTPNEIDIHIKDLAYYVKADVSGNARLQIGAFLAARDNLGSKQPGEYMDVRVEEKVFYK